VPAPAAAATAPNRPNVTVQFTGSGLYTRKDAAAFIDAINSALGDGYKLNVA
jgi:hypothetical protein